MRRFVMCEQCYRYYLRERSTSRFCGSTCRQRHHRGKDAVPFFVHSDVNRHDQIVEQFLAAVLESTPEIYERILKYRDRYGDYVLMELTINTELLIHSID